MSLTQELSEDDSYDRIYVERLQLGHVSLLKPALVFPLSGLEDILITTQDVRLQPPSLISGLR